MHTHDHTRRFIRDTLGCGCPDELLEAIECVREAAGHPHLKIDAGGRLLIYIVYSDAETDLPGMVRAMLEQGVAERNTGGFNRFRLVLATGHPGEVGNVAEQAFSASASADEKTHLHVLDATTVAGLCG